MKLISVQTKFISNKKLSRLNFMKRILLLISLLMFCVTIYAQEKEAAMSQAKLEKATFAAGCFWGVEAAFRQVKGVVSTRVGYSGGNFPNPTYEDVCLDRTGHAESVEVTFDSAKVSYEELLNAFWDIHDPTTLNQQGPDIGSQYRSIIFYHNPEQEMLAKESNAKLEKSGGFNKDPIVTEIIPAVEFYQAEDYHQQYHEKKGIAGCPIIRKK